MTPTVTLTLPTAVAQAVYDLAREWAKVESYGHFSGGDPRDFTPDEDASLPEERAAHKAACEAWERGEREPVEGAHREEVKDGTLVVSHHAVYGLGVMVLRDPALAAFCAEMERAAAALKGSGAEPPATETEQLRAQLDELKRGVHLFLWQMEDWDGGIATEAMLRTLVPQDYAPVNAETAEALLASYAQRHPEDAAKLQDLLRVTGGGGSPVECREAAGLSLGQAAKVTGLARERIEAIEQGEVATAEEFALLTHAYDVPGWARPEPPR